MGEGAGAVQAKPAPTHYPYLPHSLLCIYLHLIETKKSTPHHQETHTSTHSTPFWIPPFLYNLPPTTYKPTKPPKTNTHTLIIEKGLVGANEGIIRTAVLPPGFFNISLCRYYIEAFINIIRRYCVIIYVSHFWTPDFCLISFQSLIYTPNYLLFLPLSFFCLPLFWKITW